MFLKNNKKLETLYVELNLCSGTTVNAQEYFDGVSIEDPEMHYTRFKGMFSRRSVTSLLSYPILELSPCMEEAGRVRVRVPPTPSSALRTDHPAAAYEYAHDRQPGVI